MPDYDDDGPDNTLGPSESMDSDDVGNDDGDTVVDPPEEWIEAEEHESLDERLSEEVPDVSADDPVTKEAPRPERRDLGQIDGTPEDGGSFYDVVDEAPRL
ncbi:hypothetical protein BH09ACT8_BH09ACT8_11000 [soil metagenome]